MADDGRYGDGPKRLPRYAGTTADAVYGNDGTTPHDGHYGATGTRTTDAWSTDDGPTDDGRPNAALRFK